MWLNSPQPHVHLHIGSIVGFKLWTTTQAQAGPLKAIIGRMTQQENTTIIIHNETRHVQRVFLFSMTPKSKKVCVLSSSISPEAWTTIKRKKAAGSTVLQQTRLKSIILTTWRVCTPWDLNPKTAHGCLTNYTGHSCNKRMGAVWEVSTRTDQPTKIPYQKTDQQVPMQHSKSKYRCNTVKQRKYSQHKSYHGTNRSNATAIAIVHPADAALRTTQEFCILLLVHYLNPVLSPIWRWPD